MAEKDEKLKALQLTIDKLEKTYGKGTVMKLSDDRVIDIPAISTGSLGLDIALGVGGIPRGRIIEIYGPESSGKTTLSMHCIAEAQRAGGLAAFIDAEHAFDKIYAEKLGIDTENLLISQPDNGEQALEIAEHLIRSGAIDIIVIDSVAALVPKGELEGEMGESKMGLQARLMSQALRKLTGIEFQMLRRVGESGEVRCVGHGGPFFVLCSPEMIEHHQRPDNNKSGARDKLQWQRRKPFVCRRARKHGEPCRGDEGESGGGEHHQLRLAAVAGEKHRRKLGLVAKLGEENGDEDRKKSGHTETVPSLRWKSKKAERTRAGASVCG